MFVIKINFPQNKFFSCFLSQKKVVMRLKKHPILGKLESNLVFFYNKLHLNIS